MAPAVRSIVTLTPLEDDPWPLPAPLADVVVAALPVVVEVAGPFVGVVFDSTSVVVAGVAAVYPLWLAFGAIR
jgi:hypothetical protein